MTRPPTTPNQEQFQLGVLASSLTSPRSVDGRGVDPAILLPVFFSSQGLTHGLDEIKQHEAKVQQFQLMAKSFQDTFETHAQELANAEKQYQELAQQYNHNYNLQHQELEQAKQTIQHLEEQLAMGKEAVTSLYAQSEQQTQLVRLPASGSCGPSRLGSRLAIPHSVPFWFQN